MKTNLFGKTIDPACEYCELGRLTSDKSFVLCSKNGSKLPYDSCRAFSYDPLRRTPTRFAPLKTYDKKDFEL